MYYNQYHYHNPSSSPSMSSYNICNQQQFGTNVPEQDIPLPLSSLQSGQTITDSSTNIINAAAAPLPPITTSTINKSKSVAVNKSVSVQLLDIEIWKRFCEVNNEMIVTKSGR